MPGQWQDCLPFDSPMGCWEGSCLQRMGRQMAYTGPGWTMLDQAHRPTVYRGLVYALDGLGAHLEYGPQLGWLA
jgi:hypothetical protein